MLGQRSYQLQRPQRPLSPEPLLAEELEHEGSVDTMSIKKFLGPKWECHTFRRRRRDQTSVWKKEGWRFRKERRTISRVAMWHNGDVTVRNGIHHIFDRQHHIGNIEIWSTLCSRGGMRTDGRRTE